MLPALSPLQDAYCSVRDDCLLTLCQIGGKKFCTRTLLDSKLVKKENETMLGNWNLMHYPFHIFPRSVAYYKDAIQFDFFKEGIGVLRPFLVQFPDV